MAEYSDLEQIDSLHAEQAQINQALLILDEYNGTVSQFTVAPTNMVSIPPPSVMPPMAVTIVTVDPKQNLIAAVHANLVQRYNTINQELRNLGVTGTPPNHALLSQ